MRIIVRIRELSGVLCCWHEEEKNSKMLKLPSKSIHTVVLVVGLVLVLPISGILQKAEGLARNGSTMTHPRVSDQPLGESGYPGKLPVRNCPVLELRAGLALLSLKPALRFTVRSPEGIGVPHYDISLPIHSSIEIWNTPAAQQPPLFLLEILRI
jgi:hypothetical protein